MLLAVAVGSTAWAETSPAKAAFLHYCSACHGEGGKGDGVVAHVMRPKPPDLTLLAKNNGGEFPHTRIMRTIDGRDTVRAHGKSEMPVWGEVLKADNGPTSGTKAEVRTKVMLITDYLSTIQEK